MTIWKLFSLFAMSLLLATMLAACGGGSSSGTPPSGGQGDEGTKSAPTAQAPTSTPTPGASRGTGGCTTAASCQKAVVMITPTQVKPGGKVTITGKGWVANTKLQASIGVQAVDSDIVYATSDAQGNFSVTLTIDPRTPDIGPTNIHVSLADPTNDGSKNLNVQNQLTIIGEKSSGQADGSATCNPNGAKNVVSATPNQVKPGEKVTITGTGWFAHAKLQVSVGVQAVESDVVTTMSDERGGFSVTLTINPGTPDRGPTNIHVNMVGSTDPSKCLNVPYQLSIIG